MSGTPGDGIDDAELLARSNTDPASFGTFYRRHVDTVLGYHFRRTGCAQTAADLTAETFAAAYLARGRFRPGPAPARAWLLGIARRQLGTFARRQRVAERARRRLGVPRIELEPPDIERIEALVDLRPIAEALRAAVAQLPANQADAVRLRIGDDLSYPEVAAALGCSEGAARVRVSRGLRRLAELLEEPS